MDLLDRLLKKTRYDLMNISSNIVGVGKGFKTIHGETTNKGSVVVLVNKKLPPEALSKREKVPAKIYDVETDVIEVGDIRLLGHTDYMRPAPPGVSIGHYKITAGTFGAVVKDKATKKTLLLSNNHVFANSSNGRDGRCRIGDPIYQPGPYDGGTKDQLIGYLERFIPISREYTQAACPKAAALERVGNKILHSVKPNYRMSLFKKSSVCNLVDAAVARPISYDAITPKILDIGYVRGVKEISLGMKVKKSGRSSGFNTGMVRVLSTTLKVSLGENDNVYFTDQVIAGPMASPGDSGALVLDENNYAVGLLFAGSESATIINRIQNVMDLLKVEF
ncbi:hypothetical protein RDV78_07445 [Bacillota bacterium LX-D]|nr:hypothetical protein [Bacillota bacterium LX-D]